VRRYCTRISGLGMGMGMERGGKYVEFGGISSVERGREANGGKRVGFEKSGKGGMIGRSLRCKSRLRLGLNIQKT
jgi:hypothetical protein